VRRYTKFRKRSYDAADGDELIRGGIPLQLSEALSAEPGDLPDGAIGGTADWTLVIRERINGYLDALDGLIADGYPDPKFVEYLCEQVGRPVPGSFRDRVMDEIAHLRRELGRG